MDVDSQSQNAPTFPLVQQWLAHLPTQMVTNNRNNLPFATLDHTSSTDQHHTSHPPVITQPHPPITPDPPNYIKTCDTSSATTNTDTQADRTTR